MATNASSIAQLVQAEYEKLKASESGATPADPKANHEAATQFTVTIDGQERSFNTPQELQEFTNATLAAQRQALEAVQRNLPGQRVTAEDTAKETPLPAIDLNAYAEALRRNPTEAHLMVEKARFGGADMATILQQVVSRLNANEQVMAAYQFRDMHPEFQRTDENANALTSVMQQYNLPFTTQGLEMAYAVATKQGVIKTAEAAEHTPSPNDPYAERTAPPPMGRRSTADAPDYLSQAEELSADQLANIIAKLESGR